MKTFPSRQALYREAFPRDARVAEIGVFAGVNARNIFYLARPRELWLIDLWQRQKTRDKLSSSPRLPRLYVRVKKLFASSPRVHILKADATVAARLFPAGYFQALYLDALHTKAAVLGHLEAYFPLLAKGGIFAGHDYYNRPARDIWVKAAVDLFLHSRGLSLDFLTTDSFPSWGFVKPKP